MLLAVCRCRGPVTWAATALLLALAACGGEPELTPLAPGAVILAFGDSLTYGTGAGAQDSYPEVLSRRIGHPVVSAGVPGEVTAQGLRRLPGVLEQVRPALVVLCHGGNDILRKQPHEQTSQNLRRMIRMVREAGAQVVLLGVPRFGLFMDTADFYYEVARGEGVAMDAEILPDVLSDNALKSDNVHPNGAGYARMAQAVEALLRDRGAL
jgi:lysophospholipase L1-like esterase